MKRLAVVLVLTAAFAGLFAYGVFAPRYDRDVASPRLERPMPDFTVATFPRYLADYGPSLSLSAYSGQPVVVNFWASWCGPCAAEVPELIDVAANYDGEVELLGVNLQDTATNARSFERDQQVTYPSLFDRGAAIAAAFGGIAPEALPSTILIDGEGRVAVRLFGAVTGDILEPYLDALLAEGASAADGA